MKPANSLQVSHPSLRVVFDGIARPHLIILDKDSKEFPKLAKDLSKEQTESLVKCYEEIKNRSDVGFGRFTLTTHHGWYARNDAHFHAHIWMDIAKYKTLLRQCHYQPENRQRYKNSHSYVKEAEGYRSKMSKKHRSYLNDETRAVEKAQKANERIQVTFSGEYEVVFHHCLPYIGFHCKGSQTKAEIFYDVTQFAKCHNMTEGGDGCHACLGGQPAIKFIGRKAVDAFLLASVETFYKMLCSDDIALANQWWEKFQKCTVENPVLH